MSTLHEQHILVLGGTGKVGRRVAGRLGAGGHSCLAAGRHTAIGFDWGDPTTWPSALNGASAVFVLAPDGVDVDPAFVREAAPGRRLVLMSSRGIEAMQDTRLLAAETTVRETADSWAIIRADWFDQNFSEGFLRDSVRQGAVTVPVGGLRQAFVDAGDIAAVAAVLLTTDVGLGQTHEVTGPHAIGFAEACANLGEVIGRRVTFDGRAAAYTELMTGFGSPEAQVRAEVEAFASLAETGDAEVSDAVRRLTGRAPIGFRDFAVAAAADGAWD